MAKIYFNKYKERIDRREITVEEAIKLANAEVPKRWREAVIEMLEELIVEQSEAE